MLDICHCNKTLRANHLLGTVEFSFTFLYLIQIAFKILVFFHPPYNFFEYDTVISTLLPILYPVKCVAYVYYVLPSEVTVKVIHCEGYCDQLHWKSNLDICEV
jgi:hypothetical protein